MNKEELKGKGKDKAIEFEMALGDKFEVITLDSFYDLIDQLDEPKLQLNGKETLKERVLDLAYKEGIYGVDIQPCIEGEDVDKLLDLVDQLDEPRILSQEWINEHAKAVTYDGIPDETEVIYVDDLQNLLVPKQDKPVIPQFVADYIERMRKCNWANLTDLIGMADDELGGWWFGEKHFETLARAWLDGYKIEEKHPLLKAFDDKAKEYENYESTSHRLQEIRKVIVKALYEVD